jgi:signal transduction histidine kinase
VQETRTISYLLHPPLLDELGFASAAQWYVEGFSKRSSIEVDLKIPKELGRLSRSVELVLFRVLQEALGNVMRHAKTRRAAVSVTPTRNNLILEVRDFGVGIPPEVLETFNRTGGRVGVGLAGMRERVREQGGTFDVQSSGRGTAIIVTMPKAPLTETRGAAAAATSASDAIAPGAAIDPAGAQGN